MFFGTRYKSSCRGQCSCSCLHYSKMAVTSNLAILKNQAICLLFSSESSSDSEEEYLLTTLERKQTPKISGFIENVVDHFDDIQFYKNLRVKRRTAELLIERLKNSPHFPKPRSHGGRMPLTAKEHILSFLWFAGNKCVLRDVSQRFNMTESSLCRVIDRVSAFLLEIGPTVIKMPDSDVEKEYSASEFKKVSGFPLVLGCINGTSITIRTPVKKIKSTYTNRHDTACLTLQAICDHKKRFIDVFTGIPGKVHDARVFKMSDISKDLPTICSSQYHILGDGAYFIRPWLLTPYKDYGSLSRQEQTYNKKFCATRVFIENSFGILKGRFRQLLRLDMHSVKKMTIFIISCCILHNLCIDGDDLLHEMDVINEGEVSEEPLGENEWNLKKQGEQKRDAIKNSLQYM